MLKTIKDIAKVTLLVLVAALVFGAGHLYQDFAWSQILDLFK